MVATNTPPTVIADTPTVVSATELAKNLSDILNRVKYRGEGFVVERNGERIATIAPTDDVRYRTWGEIAELLKRVPRADDQFADDLEAVRAEQPIMQDPPEWPD